MTVARSPSDVLSRRLRLLGAVAALAMAILALSSYALTQYAPKEQHLPAEAALLTSWIEALPLSQPATHTLVAAITQGGAFHSRRSRAVAFMLPMMVASLAALAALWLLTRPAAKVLPQHVTTIQRGGVVLACICVLGFPIFTPDFWLSVAWGRMVTEGANPYANLPQLTQIAQIPVPQYVTTMTYGPLWALIAGMAALVGAKVIFLEFVAFKLVLLAAWIGTLMLLRRVAERRSTRDAAIALCLMAWLPGPLWLTVGEGHNDVVMVLFLVLWLALITGRRPLAGPLPLIGATMAKYVAAPLIGVDALYVFLTKRSSWRSYAAVLGGAAVAGLVIFAPFLATGEFLKPLEHMRVWVWWTPATALTEFTSRIGHPINRHITMPLVTTGLILVLLLQLRNLWRAPSPDTLVRVVLAVVGLEIFSLVGHVWPWFLLWGLPFAALAWRHWLGQAFLAVIVLSPLMNVAWMIAPNMRFREPFGVLVYGGAVLLTLAFVLSPMGRRLRSEPAPEWRTPEGPPTP